MKVIIFDLGKVILPFDYMICAGRLAGFSPYTAEYICQHVFKSSIIYEYESGAINSRNFFARLVDDLKLRLDFPDFYQIWGDIFTEDKQVSSIICRLKNNGYRLFLLSNTNELHFKYVYDKFDILKQFNKYILSYEIGAMKPDSRIFKQAVKLADVCPSQIVYTDDKPEYTQAAGRLGIKAITFSSAIQLEDELIKMRVNLSD